MEYVITNQQPFDEVEGQAIRALEQQGFIVQRTFSLHSATASGRDRGQAGPGYSVLMLYAPGQGQRALGLITLYEGAGRTMLQPQLATMSSRDTEAEILGVLVRGGLDVCIESHGNGRCTGSPSAENKRDGWVRDPVCGKSLRRSEALVAMDYRGARYYACCPHCRTEFERTPERYLTPWLESKRGL